MQDAEYFRSAVQPFLDGQQIRYVLSVGPSQRDAPPGGATALLHLIQFDEPFGLSVIEAMASGTPVVAFRRGSMPELIHDGVSGFLVMAGDSDAAKTAVRRVPEWNRADARRHVEKHFSAERMVDDYLRLYERLLVQDSEIPGREVVQLAHSRPPEAGCDTCHTHQSGVKRTRDGLVSVCKRCARRDRGRWCERGDPVGYQPRLPANAADSAGGCSRVGECTSATTTEDRRRPRDAHASISGLDLDGPGRRHGCGAVR